MLIGILGASLLGSMLAGKDKGKYIIRAGEATIRAGIRF